METTVQKTRWFWPWQDEKEQAWLEEMAASGWHLREVRLPCSYTFVQGEARRDVYRLDYMAVDKKRRAEYQQIFTDAGWEYVGEMSNWQYWRKRVEAGEEAEIYSDKASKIKKYQRILGYMAFFLILMVFLGSNLLRNYVPIAEWSSVVSVIYGIASLLYLIIIPIYIVVVVMLLKRIRELRREVSG